MSSAYSELIFGGKFVPGGIFFQKTTQYFIVYVIHVIFQNFRILGNVYYVISCKYAFFGIIFFASKSADTYFFDNYQVCTYPLLHVLIFPKIVNFDESTGRLISIFYFYQIFIKDISSGTCSLQSLIKSDFKPLGVVQPILLHQTGGSGGVKASLSESQIPFSPGKRA